MTLREITASRIRDGELSRRWFQDHHLDVYVWEGDDGSIERFQICYRLADENALNWQRETGFSHHRVDAGEADAKRNDAPLLMPSESPNIAIIKALVFGIRDELPAPIYAFLSDRLSEYDS